MIQEDMPNSGQSEWQKLTELPQRTVRTQVPEENCTMTGSTVELFFSLVTEYL